MTTPAPELAGFHAPADPRTGWAAIPAFGAMDRVADLDELATRVIAPNPSHMTLDGTNTYVLAVPGSGVALVVDPGPDDEAHRERVEEVLARRDCEVSAVVVTHHHHDHAEAAQAWAGRFGCSVAAPTPEVAGAGGRVIGDGERIEAGELALDVVATPGHCSDHHAFRLPTGVVLTGDHVLGRGTSIVAWPDGDLVAYLESLRRLLDLGPHALYPGHGPDMGEDAEAVVRYYLEHRAFRERQVVAVLGAGVEAPDEMVRRIYADVDERLWPAAERSTLAALHKLEAEGRARRTGEDRWQLSEEEA